MAARTPAQKRATARMIAANKAARRSPHRSSRGTSAPPKHHARKPITHLTTVAGGAIAGYGLTIQNYDNGDGVIPAIKRGDYTSVPYYVNPMNWVPAGSPGNGTSVGKKASIVLGTTIAVGGKVLGWAFPSLRRRTFRLMGHKFHLTG